jgi:hypothetical protein
MVWNLYDCFVHHEQTVTESMIDVCNLLKFCSYFQREYNYTYSKDCLVSPHIAAEVHAGYIYIVDNVCLNTPIFRHVINHNLLNPFFSLKFTAIYSVLIMQLIRVTELNNGLNPCSLQYLPVTKRLHSIFFFENLFFCGYWVSGPPVTMVKHILR